MSTSLFEHFAVVEHFPDRASQMLRTDGHSGSGGKCGMQPCQPLGSDRRFWSC